MKKIIILIILVLLVLLFIPIFNCRTFFVSSDNSVKDCQSVFSLMKDGVISRDGIF